jgi:hypothetical protein
MAPIQSGGYNPGEPVTAIIMLLAISFHRVRDTLLTSALMTTDDILRLRWGGRATRSSKFLVDRLPN